MQKIHALLLLLELAMSSRTFNISMIVCLAVIVMIGGWILTAMRDRDDTGPGPPHANFDRDNSRPGPSRANFERLREGMTLDEVEQIMGPAGLSLSSNYHREYYIFKGKDGWGRVWVSQGKVYKLSIEPTLTTE